MQIMLAPNVHSQTFENKSSPPNPPPLAAGLLCCGVCCGAGLAATGLTGAALLQPPKSSSRAILGAGWEALLDPLLQSGFWVVGAAEVPPQAEKSLDIGIDGALPVATGFGGGAVLTEGVGSGEAHASLEPQASILENADEEVEATGSGGAATFGVG